MNMSEIIISNTLRYFHIAEAAKKNSEEFSQQLKKISKENWSSEKTIEHVSSIESEVYIAIVFSVMTLESFINEYAVKKMSNTYFSKHLDGLKLISKFIIIPKLINGLSLDNSKNEFEDLKWLLSLRNDLVHFKKRKINADKLDKSKPLNQKYFLSEKHSQKAISTVRNIVFLIDPKSILIINENIYYEFFKEKKNKKYKY